jgi:hypothetical protein
MSAAACDHPGTLAADGRIMRSRREPKVPDDGGAG